MLFETTLRCFACHGYDGQTGSPRLVPMARTRGHLPRLRAQAGDAGHAVVCRTSPSSDLVDVYAYIRSIPQAAPAPDSVPLIKGILDRRTKAN